MSSIDEKIKFLERKLFEQSQSIDELTKNFQKLISINKKSKFSSRLSIYEDSIIQTKGEILHFFFKFVSQFLIYNLNFKYKPL